MNYLIYLLVALNLNVHDIHLSNTDIHYKSDQQALQLSIRMFIDDLEAAIEINTPEKLILFSDKESPLSDSLILDYIDRNLKISIDDIAVEKTYIGREMSEDLSAIWTYIEFENVESFEKINIENSLLLEMFDDQRNMINFKIDNKRKAFHILDHDDKSKEISI